MGAREDEYDYLFKGNYKHDTSRWPQIVEGGGGGAAALPGSALSSLALLSSPVTQWFNGTN